jgi:hypothetical protein
MFVCGVASTFLAGGISNSLPLPYKPLTDDFGVFNPFMWVLGLIAGFFVNRITLPRYACWVWLAGAGWLALGVWSEVHSYDPRWYQSCTASENVVNAFFVLNGRKCGGGGSTLGGIFFTTPAINSIAYSVGAWIGLLSRKRWDQTNRNEDTTTLGLSQPKP